MKIKALTIIIGSVLFMAGGLIGFVLDIGQTKMINVPEEMIDVPGPLINQERKVRELLGHPGLDSICANLAGEVIEITENTIVITQNQKLLELRVEQGAHIARRAEDTIETIKLAEIQKGERVIIYAVITEQGELVARGISIFQFLQ